jgi:hypothetical protein
MAALEFIGWNLLQGNLSKGMKGDEKAGDLLR